MLECGCLKPVLVSANATTNETGALRDAPVSLAVMKTSKASAWPVILFSTTLFLSAFLLFSLQPMFAKMVLPRLGGTPAVWNTCMVFFQAALLAGYGYAHLATSRLETR